MQKNYRYFSNREGRARFIAHTFKKELDSSQTILDVGCDYNSLKKTLGEKVTGVDLYGSPDIQIDFEKEKLSRFESEQFDFVVCTEVLEHLDNFYEMTDELLRVSRKYILISLPNCMDLFTRLRILFLGKAGKFYGLPIQEPEDRHRWFFGHKDIDCFFLNLSKQKGLIVSRRFLHCNFSGSWKGNVVRIFVKLLNLDMIAQSYWILLKKAETDT